MSKSLQFVIPNGSLSERLRMYLYPVDTIHLL